MKIFNSALSITLGALLSGCANFQTNIQPENNFRLVALSGLPAPPTRAIGASVTSSPDPVARLIWHRAQAISCSDHELAAQDGNFDNCSGLVRVYLEAAITASNQACNTWFDLLIHSDVETTYAKNLFNLVGNSAQALMGLTGDSPTQIAKVALALGVGNSSFDNYRAIYLMSPTLYKIRKKIAEARLLATNSIRSKADGYNSWDDADEDMQAYHKSCSRETIQEILNSGLEATEYKLNAPDSDEVMAKDANQQLYLAVFGASGEFSATELTLLADNQAVISTPMPIATDPLVKAAQSKFALLEQKGKSDFNRWLETSKRILDAKTKSAAAKVTLAETKKLAEEKAAKEKAKDPNTVIATPTVQSKPTTSALTEYGAKFPPRISFKASTNTKLNFK